MKSKNKNNNKEIIAPNSFINEIKNEKAQLTNKLTTLKQQCQAIEQKIEHDEKISDHEYELLYNSGAKNIKNFEQQITILKSKLPSNIKKEEGKEFAATNKDMVLDIQELIVKASGDLVPHTKEVTIKQGNGFRIDYKVNTQGGAFEIQDNGYT